MNLAESKIEEVFLRALEIPSTEDRMAYLQRACGGDHEFCHRIERMLAAQPHMGDFLVKNAAEMVRTNDPTAAECLGTMIGPYKLLQQIGEGGMGTVFMAEQSKPVHRKVALKVIKPGLDSRQVIARFEAERQTLAMMDHVNIARVFDGGTTESGRPFFVMELVHGVPITKYCDDNHLTPRERLELFVPVCEAVQHAHQKGIIHRDVKPSNVMITLYDGKPVPKVIDFGVAKATDQKLTERTLFTQYGAMVGTLEYMSPEQADMSALGIDTRSDIYSLGVLLYELLTGSTPLSHKRVKDVAFAEILRIIKEEEPPKPSTRLSDSGDALASISANRHTEPARLTKQVSGELDWIVMKALEKDRNRRYESAIGFAQDVQRYLVDEPVQACPPTARYRLNKFLRRNKGPLMAAALVILILIAGITGTSWGLWHSEQNRRKAEGALAAEMEARQAERQARDQAMAALRSMTDEIVQNHLARETQLRDEDKEFLRKIIRHFEGLAATTSNDAESRAIRAEGYAQVGLMRRRLGELKEAESVLVKAVEIFQQLAAEFPSRPHYRQEVARSQSDLGIVLRATGRHQDAEAAFADARTIYTQLVTDFPDRSETRQNLARSNNNLANLFKVMGRLPEAEAAYTEALAGQNQLATDYPDRHDFRLEQARTQNNLADLFRVTGRLKEAEAAFNDAIANHKKLVADFPNRPEFLRELAASQNNIGILYRETGRPKQAEAAYGDALALYKQLAADYPTVPEYRNELALSHNNLGRIYNATGRLEQAEDQYADALIVQKKLAVDFPNRSEFRLQLARSQNKLGSLLEDLDRRSEAEAAFDDALTITKQLVTDFPASLDCRLELAGCHNNLGVLFRKTGRLTEAEAALTEALTIKKQLVAEFPNQPDRRHSLAGTFANLAILSDQRQDFVSAKAYLEEALPHQQLALKANPRHPDYRKFYRENLIALASANTWLNDQAGVVVAAEVIRDLGWDPPVDAYHAARSLAQCSSTVQKHEQLDATQRHDALQFYSDQAMAMLRDAVAKGWKDATQMNKDTNLDQLRHRDDFQQLLRELEHK